MNEGTRFFWTRHFSGRLRLIPAGLRIVLGLFLLWLSARPHQATGALLILALTFLGYGGWTLIRALREIRSEDGALETLTHSRIQRTRRSARLRSGHSRGPNQPLHPTAWAPTHAVTFLAGRG